MKIGTITVHNGKNYGASLQAFALVHALRKIGVDAYLIDYHNDTIENKLKNQVDCDWSRLNAFPSNLKRIINRSSYNRTITRFQDFYSQILDISGQSYSTKDNMSGLNDLYDGFICGSDQIWNSSITGSDLRFFLDFANDDKVKVSYAASVGGPKLAFNNEALHTISHILRKYNGLSVRESINVQEIQEISNIHCYTVVDPTLLVSKNEWIDISKSSCIKIPKDPYILYYQVLDDDEFYRTAIKYAKSLHLNLIRIDWHPLKAIINGCSSVSNYGIGPFEFLDLAHNAKYIISNSFHGTVFSLVFEKPFFTYELPKKHKNKGTRIQELLSSVDLSERLTRDFSSIDIDTPIEWSHVKQVIDQNGEKSLSFIKESLSLK